MSREETVRVEGLGALIRALKAAEVGVDDLKRANQEASRIVLAAAQTRAPRRTGALAASGRVNKAARKANVLFGNARVPYAGVINYGWPARHIKAHPFATDAVEATRAVWLPLYESDLQRILDEI
jgi:hypothetical protein